MEFCKRTPKARLFGAAVPTRPKRFCLDDDQIDIRIRGGVTAGARAEKDHLLGISYLNDGRRHPPQKRIVNHGHVLFHCSDASIIPESSE